MFSRLPVLSTYSAACSASSRAGSDSVNSASASVASVSAASASAASASGSGSDAYLDNIVFLSKRKADYDSTADKMAFKGRVICSEFIPKDEISFMCAQAKQMVEDVMNDTRVVEKSWVVRNEILPDLETMMRRYANTLVVRTKNELAQQNVIDLTIEDGEDVKATNDVDDNESVTTAGSMEIPLSKSVFNDIVRDDGDEDEEEDANDYTRWGMKCWCTEFTDWHAFNPTFGGCTLSFAAKEKAEKANEALKAKASEAKELKEKAAELKALKAKIAELEFELDTRLVSNALDGSFFAVSSSSSSSNAPSTTTTSESAATMDSETQTLEEADEATKRYECCVCLTNEAKWGWTTCGHYGFCNDCKDELQDSMGDDLDLDDEEHRYNRQRLFRCPVCRTSMGLSAQDTFFPNAKIVSRFLDA